MEWRPVPEGTGIAREQSDGPILELEGLRVTFGSRALPIEAVRGISLTIEQGEIFGLVGESGAGKSSIARSIVGLTGDAAVEGSIRFQGIDLGPQGGAGFKRIRGAGIALVPQESMASITPVRRVGALIEETLAVHDGGDQGSLEVRALELLEEVGFKDPRRIHNAYSHELSGGMRQRAVIAMALAPEPDLIVADEPTASLDSIARARILELILEVRQSRGMAVMLVTHDLDAIRRAADRVAVVKNGHLVETGSTTQILGTPVRPSARTLAGTRPAASSPAGIRPVIEVSGVSFSFPSTRRHRADDGAAAPALDEIDLKVGAGETVSVVGGTGSGKTTLARTVVGLLTPDTGSIRFSGTEIAGLRQSALRSYRRRMGLVLQDSVSSLNPRHSIGRNVMTPLLSGTGIRRVETRSRARGALRRTGLGEEYFERMPQQLSGGERQRAGLARALVGEPELLICDEPVSGLDRTSETEILTLLKNVIDDSGLACLFITHDLRTARAASNRLAVMYRGRIVESGSIDTLLSSPHHPHTIELLEASTLEPAGTA